MKPLRTFLLIALTAATLTATALLAADPQTPPTPPSTPQKPHDEALKIARENPTGLMFTASTTSRADELAYELVITSAKGIDGTPERVRLLPGSIRIFRPDTSRDDFTKSGGWYWKIHDKEGKSQLPITPEGPGMTPPLIMVIRDLDGTVHWHSLNWDIRC